MQEISAFMGITQHLVLPPNHILSVLVFCFL